MWLHRESWCKQRYRKGNLQCFPIQCLQAEVTQVILWNNRYDQINKWSLHWIQGCMFHVKWFNCYPGLLQPDTWQYCWFFWLIYDSSLYDPNPRTANINIVAAFRGMHVSSAKHSYAWLPRKCNYQESVTTGQTDGQTDKQTPDKVIPMCRYASQATQKHSYAWLPRKCDYQESVTTGQTDGQTGAGQSDPYVPLCFAGDTKSGCKSNDLWLTVTPM